MAVGRRAGLPVELINMPMHIISCLQPGMLPQMMPEGAEAAAGPSAVEIRSETIMNAGVEGCSSKAEDEEEPQLLYVDVYGGGKIMDRDQLE